VEPIEFLKLLRRRRRILTPFAERRLRTLRHELPDGTPVWNERQLRTLPNEYIDHHNTRPGHAPPGTLSRTP
jgi:hypothetical protein